MLVTSLATAMELSQCGGKAIRLNKLLASGWNVPPGWVVTNQAFQLFRIAVEGDGGSANEQLALATPVPHAVLAEIQSALANRADADLFAVRSSAVGEDSQHAAYAGQLDTFLHVRPTIEAISDALRACWASYWSSRVLEYQRARGVRLQGMGVIIQQLVPGVISGVMFTRHPAAESDPASANAIWIEYCEGLGEALVAGRITPNRCIVHRPVHAGQSISQRSDETSPPAETSTRTLHPSALEALTLAADRIEALFDGPQDVEWTCDSGGRVHWLQSRPITTLRHSPSRNEHDSGAIQIWSNANLNENYPEPVCPLLGSIAQQSYYYYFRNLGTALGVASDRIAEVECELQFIVGTHKGRLYYNLTSIGKILRAAPFGDWLVSAFLDFVGASDDQSNRPSAKKLPSWTRRFSETRETLRIVWRAGRAMRRMRTGITEFESTVDAYAVRTRPERLNRASWEELLALWRAFFDIRFHQWLPASLGDAASMVGYGLLKRWLQHGSSEMDIHNGLLRGLRDIVSVGPAESLFALAQRVKASPKLQTIVRAEPGDRLWQLLQTDSRLEALRYEFLDWLEKWGFRCSGELLLTVPSYQEQPAVALELLRAYVLLDGDSPADQLLRQELEREEATDHVMQSLASIPIMKWLPWPRRDWVARRLLSWTQTAIICRERARLKQALLYQRLRRLALAIGERLVLAEILNAPADIFYLSFQEIEALLAGGSRWIDSTRSVVALRRTQLESQRSESPPETLRLRRGERLYEQSSAAEHPTGVSLEQSDSKPHAAVLRGIPACGGVIEGTARVLESVLQIDRIAVGDILVARQTDPGWATIFPLVSGIVLERGGMLSHGAILAREYGLPTVVAVPHATLRLAGNVRVRVNGDRGEIVIIDDNARESTLPDRTGETLS